MATLIPKYDQGATGAVNRAINLKLAEQVSVLDFGADATGVTDSSTAFASAIATGKSVFVPKGTYQVSVDLAAYTKIYGESERGVSTLIPPTGASYILRMDATSTAKIHCQIRDLGFENPNSIANVTAIVFKGTDVYTINDQHVLDNLYFNGVYKTFDVTGRLIACSFKNIMSEGGGTYGMTVSTDPVNPAFITNIFENVQFYTTQKESLRIVGVNVTNSFINCTFQSANRLNVAGVAAVYVEDSQMINFQNCYFEDNGTGVAVDTGNYLNNSIGLWFAGTICFVPSVKNCWMVQSGVLILSTATVGIVGGKIEGNRMAPLSNGWSIYNIAKSPGADSPPLNMAANNYSGKMGNELDGNGQFSMYVEQTDACRYIPQPSVATIDLRNTKKIVFNWPTPDTISTIVNSEPGMEFWVYNYGAGTITIAGALVFGGVAVTLTTGQKAIFMVGGYPTGNTLIRMV